MENESFYFVPVNLPVNMAEEEEVSEESSMCLPGPWFGFHWLIMVSLH